MTATAITDRQALEALVIDNEDLERLESLIGQFNIFEATGMLRQEIRHSHFLAFLLDPNQNHGLGDCVLRKLLQEVLTKARDLALPISLVDLDVWDLDETTIQRETNNIDILALNETHQLAIIIENKIDSDEHSNQLARYWKHIEARYPEWRMIGLFLTRDGDLPSDERFLPVSYARLATTLDTLVKNRGSVLGQDVQTLIRHYVQMLRTHIVSGSEIDQLCTRLYQKHQRALDLIFERRPDRQAHLQAEITTMLHRATDFLVDKSTKSNILFLPKTWDVPSLRCGTRWGNNPHLMMYLFENRQDALRILLQIGPGQDAMRKRLFSMAQRDRNPFTPGRTMTQDWSRIYTRKILTKKQIEDLDLSELMTEVEKQWADFLNGDFIRIEQSMKAEDLI